MRINVTGKLILGVLAVVTFSAVAADWGWGEIEGLRQAAVGLALLTAALFWPPAARA